MSVPARILLFLLFTLLDERHVEAQEAQNVLLDKPCPEFEFKALDNQTFNSSQLLGNVIVLNFWYTGCAPCIKEIKQLNKVASKYEGRSIQFLAITWEDDLEMLRDFSRIKAMKFKVVAEGRPTIGKFLVNMYPTSVIIDQKGFVRFFESGFYGDIETKLNKKIDSLFD